MISDLLLPVVTWNGPHGTITAHCTAYCTNCIYQINAPNGLIYGGERGKSISDGENEVVVVVVVSSSQMSHHSFHSIVHSMFPEVFDDDSGIYLIVDTAHWYLLCM